MNKFLNLAVVGLAAVSMVACGGSGKKTASGTDSLAADTVPAFATFDARDLCLIYQGGAHRIDWTEEHFEPYVTHQFAGDTAKHWLFDGFLFLEFKDGKGRQYSPGYDKQNARKTEWEWYLDRLFEKDKSLDALDKTIEKNKALLGDPGFRHKVVLTILVPIDGQKDWGEVAGEALDFSKDEDKVKATEWFIDQLVDRFNAQGYKNLDLDGFYWVAEGGTESNLPPFVAPYVHKKGYKFVWIPYWNSPGAADWKKAGFDIAYQQPNHFFQTEIPDERLDEAVAFGLANNMGMEFEFDSRILSDPDNFASRMNAYIDAYERGGVFDKAALAYYEGGHGFYDVMKDPKPAAKAAVDRLARHIVDRQSKPELTKK